MTYVLTSTLPDEGSIVLGAFTTLAAARAFAEASERSVYEEDAEEDREGEFSIEWLELEDWQGRKTWQTPEDMTYSGEIWSVHQVDQDPEFDPAVHR